MSIPHSVSRAALAGPADRVNHWAAPANQRIDLTTGAFAGAALVEIVSRAEEVFFKGGDNTATAADPLGTDVTDGTGADVVQANGALVLDVRGRNYTHLTITSAGKTTVRAWLG